MNQYILAVSLLLLAVAANATEDVCSSDYFNCNQHNPCKQLCVPGQMNYHGLSRKLYVTCDNNGGCTSNTCENEEFFNRFEHKCLAWGSSSTSNESVDGRCDTDKYNCQENNPCIEPRCTDSLTYPGYWRNQYVQCGAQGECHEKKCARRHAYDDITAACVLKEEEAKPVGEIDMDIWEEYGLGEGLPACELDESPAYNYGDDPEYNKFRFDMQAFYNTEEKKTDAFDIMKTCTESNNITYMVKYSTTNYFSTCYTKDGFCVPGTEDYHYIYEIDEPYSASMMSRLAKGQVIDTCTRNTSVLALNTHMTNIVDCMDSDSGHYVYTRPADMIISCHSDYPCGAPSHYGTPTNLYKKKTTI